MQLLVLCPYCNKSVDVDTMIVMNDGTCCCQDCYDEVFDFAKELDCIFGEEEI